MLEYSRISQWNVVVRSMWLGDEAVSVHWDWIIAACVGLEAMLNQLEDQ